MTDKYYRIVLDSSKAEAGAKRFDSSMRGAGRSVDNFDGGLNRTNKTAAALTTTMRPLAAAISAAISIQQVTSYADSWTQVQNKLRIVTKSQDELTLVTGRLFDVAQNTRASFESTTDLYSKMVRSTKELNLSQDDLVNVTTTINQLFAASGATTQEADSAIRQLAQGFASGALRGDEFNSVAEQAPDILKAVSKFTGVAEGKLRDMAAQGKITSKILIESLKSYGGTAEEIFNKTTATFTQNATAAKNNAIAFVGATSELTGAITLLGDGLVVISENLGFVKDVFLAFSAIIGARMVSATFAYTASVWANVAAMTASTTTVNAYGAAVARTTLATHAMTAAATAGSRAYLLLGGPVGAIALAAGSVAYFVSKMETAEEKSSRLARELSDLTTTYKALDDQARASKLLDLNEKIAATTKNLADATKELEDKQKSLNERQAEGVEVGFQAGNMMAEMGRATYSNTVYVDRYAESVKKLTEDLGVLKNQKGALTGVISAGDAEPVTASAEPVKTDFSLERMKLDTSSMEEELALRNTILSYYSQTALNSQLTIWERESEAFESKLATDTAAKENQILKERELLQLKRDEYTQESSDTDAIKIEKIALYNEQILLLDQEKELALLEIARKGTVDRELLEKRHAQTKLSIAGGVAGQLLSLAEEYGGKSFKKNKALMVTLAAAQGIAAGIASYKAGTVIGGPPVGAVYAGISALKTGLAIRKLKNVGGGSGGGGGSTGGSFGGASVPSSASPAYQSSTQSIQQAQSKKLTIELTGVDRDDKLTVGQVEDLFNNKIGEPAVAIVINDTINNAKRTGDIDE